MHENPNVRGGASRCLAAGGPYVQLGRTDRWSGNQLVDPTIHGIAHFGGGREANALEEELVREAFAAFRTAYMSGLKELAGEQEAPAPLPMAKAAW